VEGGGVWIRVRALFRMHCGGRGTWGKFGHSLLQYLVDSLAFFFMPPGEFSISDHDLDILRPFWDEDQDKSNRLNLL
jgi:hypothetical protein